MGTIWTHADAIQLSHYDPHADVEGIHTADAVPGDHELPQVVARHLEVLFLCISCWRLATLNARRIVARPPYEVRIGDEDGRVAATVPAQSDHERRMSFTRCGRHEDRQAVRDPGAEDDVVDGASDLAYTGSMKQQCGFLLQHQA